MISFKEDITYGAAQARLSEDDALRVRYKGGDPLEGGKIAESEPVELFSAAHNIEKQQRRETGESDRAGEAAASDEGRDQSQQHQPQSANKDVESISGDEDADENSQAKSIHSVVVRHHHRRPVAGVHADVLHRQGNGRFSGLWKSESCCSSSRE
nr:seed maturation protein [Ipomoea batatas]